MERTWTDRTHKDGLATASLHILIELWEKSTSRRLMGLTRQRRSKCCHRSWKARVPIWQPLRRNVPKRQERRAWSTNVERWRLLRWQLEERQAKWIRMLLPLRRRHGRRRMERRQTRLREAANLQNSWSRCERPEYGRRLWRIWFYRPEQYEQR